VDNPDFLCIAPSGAFTFSTESGNYKNRPHVSEEVKDLLHDGGKLCLLEPHDCMQT
jgi:hypothetical protein